MEKITSTVYKKDQVFEHTVVFEFEGKKFQVEVMESPEETYVIRSFWIQEKRTLAIDIPKFFGAFGSDVYTFIYDNIQRGYEK